MTAQPSPLPWLQPRACLRASWGRVRRSNVPFQRLLLSVVALAALQQPGPSWANASAAAFGPSTPSHSGGAFVARPTALVVDTEELTFDCDERGCTFSAVYHVRNPSTAQREEVLGAFYGIETGDFTATADGADARHPLTSEQLQTLDAGAPPHPDARGEVTREGFTLAVDAGRTATLVFSGRMHPFASRIAGGVAGYGSIAPTEARHPWFGTEWRPDSVMAYEYALWPIRQWAGSPAIAVTVRSSAADLSLSTQDGEWSVDFHDGRRIARRTIAAKDASTLEFRLVLSRGTAVLNGGPLLGLGARLDSPRFRLRGGYEAAFPWWIVGSAALETDFQDTVTLVPVAEVVSPNLLGFIPSLGLGAGLPLQVRSASPLYAGARFQFTASWPVLSVLLPVDFFPAGPSNQRWQVALFGQASF